LLHWQDARNRAGSRVPDNARHPQEKGLARGRNPSMFRASFKLRNSIR
jgi:hypothetical protein